MAADRSLSRRLQHRRGFALFAIVIGMVVITIIAALMLVPISGDNKQARIQRAADVLHRLVAEMDTASGQTVNYYRGHMASSTGAAANRPRWPGRLSHLYTQPLTTEVDCNNVQYGTANIAVTQWRGPYHLVPIATTGHNVAAGFFADNALVRVSNTEAYIRMAGVALDDAKALDLTVDKVANAAAGAVRYTPTGTTPTVLEYHFTAASGAPCS